MNSDLILLISVSNFLVFDLIGETQDHAPKTTIPENDPNNCWTACSAACGVGERKNLHNLPICRDFDEIQVCHDKQCPADCQFVWNRWGVCSVTCGEGSQFRTPLVKTRARHGGKVCAGVQKRSCNPKECPTAVTDLTPTSVITSTETKKRATTEYKTTTPVFPLNEIEEIVVTVVHSFGCTFILGSLAAALVVFLILRYC